MKTPYGEFQTVGDQLMRTRIKELNALNALEKTNDAQKFGEGAVKAGLGPVVFAGNLIAHPVDTTQGTFAGVGQFFNSVGSGLNNMGKSRDNAVASLTGESRQKRLIATELGVDPYTDFKPLADRLDALGRRGRGRQSRGFGRADGGAGRSGRDRLQRLDRQHASGHRQQVIVSPAHGPGPPEASAARRGQFGRQKPRVRQSALHAP